MRIQGKTKVFVAFLILNLLVDVALADSGLRKSKNPADNIYGVGKNSLERSFGDRGKTIDRSDLSRNQKVQTKKEKKPKEKKATSGVTNLNDLPIPSEDDPNATSPVGDVDENWQRF